ncbi:ATP-dependent metallopeptidase FtsH/Yme1/Tma family protein [Escherichia coli]
MAKNLILWLVIAVVLMSVFNSFSPSDTTSRQLDYSSFVKEVTQEQIREVRMDGKVINGVKRTGGTIHHHHPCAGSPAAQRHAQSQCQSDGREAGRADPVDLYLHLLGFRCCR